MKVMERPQNEIVCLGAYGGIDMSNLSSWILRVRGVDYLFDAGSPLNGISVYNKYHSRQGHIDTKEIKGIFISHAHLDHIAGLIILSPILIGHTFPIVGFPQVTHSIQQCIFNQSIWPNIFTTGKKDAFPPIFVFENGNYDKTKGVFIYDAPTITTWMFPITHADYGDTHNTILQKLDHTERAFSTCFLVQPKEENNVAFVYFGDVSLSIHPYLPEDPDQEPYRQIQKVIHYTHKICHAHTKVHVFLECAFSSHQPSNLLVGHINTLQFIKIVQEFADTIPKSEINFFVTHRKPDFKDGAFNCVELEFIETELGRLMSTKYWNGEIRTNVRLIFPKQGMSWDPHSVQIQELQAPQVLHTRSSSMPFMISNT